MIPDRDSRLQQWLKEQCGFRDFSLVPASEDASFRRYFRVGLPDGGTRIVMDAPPDKEDCAPFVDVSRRLREAGVHVPAIEQQDIANGFLLLEDLGDDLYLGALSEQSVESLYGDAIAAILRFQRLADPQGLPCYDRVLLQREMQLFPEWLLRRHLQLTLTVDEQGILEQASELLVTNALAQPRVLVHRDYHSRNLLVSEAANPGIIDFQDAVLGPLTYDLVSLLRDCYISWPTGQVDAWVAGYAGRALEAGLINAAEASQVPEWFDLMGVQRHLKAAGIFARLNHRDGKAGYLKDIPRTLRYIVEVGGRRTDMADLAGFIAQRVLPRLVVE